MQILVVKIKSFADSWTEKQELCRFLDRVVIAMRILGLDSSSSSGQNCGEFSLRPEKAM